MQIKPVSGALTTVLREKPLQAFLIVMLMGLQTATAGRVVLDDGLPRRRQVVGLLRAICCGIPPHEFYRNWL